MLKTPTANLEQRDIRDSPKRLAPCISLIGTSVNINWFEETQSWIKQTDLPKPESFLEISSSKVKKPLKN